MVQYIIAFGVILFVAIVIWLVYFVNLIHRKKQIKESLGMKLLLVRLPNQALINDKGAINFKEEINASQLLFSILASQKDVSSLEVAVHNIGEEINFYISVPEKSAEFISRQIEGLFKDAQIEHSLEYNIFHTGGFNAGVYLKQDKHYSLMFRSYLESDVDTFSPIVSGLSKINEICEGVAIQILIKPAPDSYKKNIFNMINNLRKGASFKDLSSSNLFNKKDLGLLFGEEKKSENEEKKPSIVDDDSIKNLEKKISCPLLLVNYRILVSSTNQLQTDSLLNGLIGSLAQFDSPLRNKIKAVKVKNFGGFSSKFMFREYDDSQTMVLNTEELASMVHLPSSSTLSSKIKWLRSKEAPAPLDLQTSGTNLGNSLYRGLTKPVFITDEDRRRHIYIIGQTGTGKSVLMTSMAWEDMKKGKGIAIIDPHGELVDSILSLVPKERIDDVVVFDPANVQRPIGLNMLEYNFDRPEEKTFVINEIISIFDKLYDLKTTGGPMFEYYLRGALLLLLADLPNEPATLMEVPRIFTDDEYRKRKLARITDPVVIDFWEKMALKAGGDLSLANVAPYITSKFNQFITNDFMKLIVGQATSSINFRKIMDEGKILLVPLAKGRLGDINANLLGMLVIGKLLLAAFSRFEISEKERKMFNLYIDEFQNFSTDSIGTILAEARKYGLTLTMAHQFITQLTEKIKDAVFGNVGSMVVFRVGTQDAEAFSKVFDPVFKPTDLVNIDNFNAYTKILINGRISTPFNIQTPHWKEFPSNKDQISKIKELSSLKYGRDRMDVEKEILSRLRS